MQATFCRYISIQGRFDPNTDDIKVFIGDAKQTAYQLDHNDTAVLYLIKASMPADMFGTLYPVQELDVAIVMLKDISAKKPECRTVTGTTHCNM